MVMVGLNVENLVVRFASRTGPTKTLFAIPHWRVDSAARVCLAGASGTGKTTLLYVLAGLLQPSEGRVRIGDVVLTDLAEATRDEFRARHVGMVFQTSRLLPGLNALENVALAATIGGMRRRPARERAAHLLAQVGVAENSTAHPAELSVGERQRVAIARAFAADPKLLLADEPTASLDPERTHEIISLLQSVAEENKTTVVLVTHERDVQARFATVVRLEDLWAQDSLGRA